MFLGILLLVIGVIFILKALGLITSSSWTLFWGLIFLIAGIKLVSKKKHCVHCDWFGYKHDSKDSK